MFSSRRGALTWSDIRVGLFLMAGIFIMVIAIFFLQPGKHLAGGSIKVRSVFSTVSGLFEGAAVHMSGVQVGSVSNIRFLPSPNEIASNQSIIKQLATIRDKMNRLDVTTANGHDEYQKLERDYTSEQSKLKQVSVLMEISKSYEYLLGANSIAMIKGSGIVGDKYVEISSSPPDSPRLTPSRDSSQVTAIEISGEEAPDMNRILANAQSTTGSVENLVNTLDSEISHGHGTIGKLLKDPSVANNLNTTLKETSRATHYTGDLMLSVRDGKGSIGKLFNNPALYNSLSDVMISVKSGKGTAGKLIYDPRLYDEAESSMKDFSSLSHKLNDGSGSLGKLINDPGFYKNANAFVTDSALLVRNTNEGKGSLGKFANDQTFYNNANQAMSGIAVITDKINKGEGSLGVLMNDKRLANNLTAASEELLAFVREFRKNPKKYLTIQMNVIKLF